MKNLLRLKTVIIASVLVIGFTTSCDKENLDLQNSNLDDAQLIEAIQSATLKQAVTEEELPNATKSILETEHIESYTHSANKAANLGYEVQRRCHKGEQIGEQYHAYFNLEGRELNMNNNTNSKNRNRYRNQHRKGEKLSGCFDYVLPVTFDMPDSSEITITSDEDWALIKEWYEANPDNKERPSVQFPANIMFKDSTIATVESQEDLQTLRKDCGENIREMFQMKSKCFHFVLPITFTMPDETTVTITEKEDWSILKEWHAENPDAEVSPTLQFPVEIIFRDSTSLTVVNQEEIDLIRENCKEERKERSLFTRNIINPIVYIDECDYPVSGTVEIIFNDQVVAVIDYGDGTCDNIATITTDDETVEYKIKRKRKRNS